MVKWERNFENDPNRDVHLREKLSGDIVERNKVFSCIVYLSRKIQKTGKNGYLSAINSYVVKIQHIQ